MWDRLLKMMAGRKKIPASEGQAVTTASSPPAAQGGDPGQGLGRAIISLLRVVPEKRANGRDLDGVARGRGGSMPLLIVMHLSRTPIPP